MDYSGFEAYASSYAAAGHGTLTRDDYARLWLSAQKPAPTTAAPPAYVQAYYSSASANSGIPVGLTKDEIVLYKEAQKKAWQEYRTLANAHLKNPFAEAAGPSTAEKPVKQKVVYDPFKAKKVLSSAESAAASAASKPNPHDPLTPISSKTDIVTEAPSSIPTPPPPPPPLPLTSLASSVSVSNPASLVEIGEPMHKENNVSTQPAAANVITSSDQAHVNPSSNSHQQLEKQYQREEQQQEPSTTTPTATTNKFKLVLKPSTESKLNAPVALTKDQEILAQYDARIEAENAALAAFLVEQEKIRERVAKAIESRTKQCMARVQALTEARELERTRQEERRIAEEAELKRKLEEEARKEEEEEKRLKEIQNQEGGETRMDTPKCEKSDETGINGGNEKTPTAASNREQGQAKTSGIGSAVFETGAEDEEVTALPTRTTVGGRESGPNLFLPPPPEPVPEKSKRRRRRSSASRSRSRDRRSSRRSHGRHHRDDSDRRERHRGGHAGDFERDDFDGRGDGYYREYDRGDATYSDRYRNREESRHEEFGHHRREYFNNNDTHQFSHSDASRSERSQEFSRELNSIKVPVAPPPPPPPPPMANLPDVSFNDERCASIPTESDFSEVDVLKVRGEMHRDERDSSNSSSTGNSSSSGNSEGTARRKRKHKSSHRDDRSRDRKRSHS
ncbi:hypothetical protein BDR26DRAFT_853354 [Obelidium mucronatum]|nr:hypothetical protein BDR26DRAFT_853354 [Obelidium mucronatum]